ncbi:MAG: DoxX family protein [Phycisphaerales bacterium]|jgi:uncharacterized membrane protein YphA (DoxX/SURF4 family)|nr:DoxX family protein [Phycisphaerales bacterium]
MSSTSTAGTGILRLLTRLVLGTAFFFSGWHACFQDVAFTAEEIRSLEGVPVAPIEVALRSAPVAAPAAAPAERAATSPEAASSEARSPEATPPAEASAAPDESAAASPLQPIGPFASTGPVERAAAERWALSLREAGVGDFAEPLAWAAAVASLLGGPLVLIGLLTRFFALTMAVMLGASFWFASVVDAGLFGTNPFEWWVEDEAAVRVMFAQAAFFVLAVGLLIKGPGGLSIDRIIWPSGAGSPQPSPEPYDEV